MRDIDEDVGRERVRGHEAADTAMSGGLRARARTRARAEGATALPNAAPIETEAT